jgi:hypothetical protein
MKKFDTILPISYPPRVLSGHTGADLFDTTLDWIRSRS